MTTRNKKLALPRPIKSKNPVVILRHVIKAIKAEPKRYDQGTYVELRGSGLYDESYFPSCGTVCCVAGWVNIIAGKPHTNYTQQATIAADVLGLDDIDEHELFNGSPYGVRRRDDVTPQQHAADGIKHIKRFVLQKWGKKI